MPEGHTLHRLAGALHGAFAGTHPAVTSPQGRFIDGAAALDGRTLDRAEAYGKHLFVTFEQDRILGVHLGLIGSFDVLRHDGEVPPPVGAVRVRLATDRHHADLRGATVVHLVTPDEVEATIARLGPDPLRVGTPGNDPARSLARLARTSRPVAQCLMDQSIIAGVGNVYRCEVLWRHRIDPYCPGRSVKTASWLAMWEDLVTLMPLGVAFGQIITLDSQAEQARELLGERLPTDYDPSWGGMMAGERGQWRRGETAFPREYAVYKRTGQPCLRCGSTIRAAEIGGRTLYWCGRCQRRH